MVSATNRQDVNAHSEFIWSVADLLRGNYKKHEYGSIILPFVTLRRLDCVLESTKPKVLELVGKYKGGRLEAEIRQALRQDSSNSLNGDFYNTYKLNLDGCVKDSDNIKSNLEEYVSAFSENIEDVFVQFKFLEKISDLQENGLLYLVASKFIDPKFDLHPEKVSNHDMGAIYEEVIRKFSEASNETSGEHFTSRDAVRLGSALLLSPERETLTQSSKICRIYDPTAGTGGLLSETASMIEGWNPKSEILLYGQELNPESYAICKSDMAIKGQSINNIKKGDTLAEDQFKGQTFEYLVANPPYGTEWKKSKEGVETEHKLHGFRGLNSEDKLPAISDGQLLFLMHIVSKLDAFDNSNKGDAQGGRAVVFHNGSALFSGSAEGGESKIRQYVLENDLLEAIVALPTDMFFNTNITTYIWILSNRKSPERKGKVQLIDASSRFTKMRKNLGKKNKEITKEDRNWIVEQYVKFNDTTFSKIFDTHEFFYNLVTVERPLLDKDGKPEVDKKGQMKADSKLRDTERIPWGEDIDEYIKREVKPYHPDAWADESKTKVGVEIPFNRYFYSYEPPRPVEEIDKELAELTRDILKLLGGRDDC